MALSEAKDCVAVSSCFILFAALTTLLRLYTRGRIFHRIGPDDVFIVLAMTTGIALLGLIHQMAYAYRDVLRGNGPGREISPTLDPRLLGRLMNGNKLSYVGSQLYTLEIALIKLSLLAFYKRFLPPRPYHPLLYAIGGFTASVAIATTFAGIFACDPISGAWDPTIPGMKCRVDIYALCTTYGFFNVITDLIILLVPLPVVFRLQADRKKKFAMVILFSFGMVGTAATIVRLVKLFQIRSMPKELFTDLLGAVMDNIAWSMIEVGLLILCANLPGIYALHRRREASKASKGSYRSGYSDPNPTPRLDYDLESKHREHTGTVTSAYGHCSSTSSSNEQIIAEPDTIHLSTRVAVEVE